MPRKTDSEILSSYVKSNWKYWITLVIFYRLRGVESWNVDVEIGK